MNTTESGRQAELAAKVYLEMRGFEIIEQNFRRPRCEIDIVARKNGMVQFVEVKYRKNYDNGGGFDAITITKLNQMRRAAHIWIDETKWSGEYMVSAVEVAGTDYQIMDFIEDVLY